MTIRSVDTRFWSDGWVRKLNALDRYLFIYLITNDHTTWCGIYELDLSMMAFESGIDKEDLERSILPRLSPKVIYVDGWVYVPNWIKYHLSGSGNMSPQQKKGFEKTWDDVPERIRLKIKDLESSGIPYTYPIGGVSASTSTITSTSSSLSEQSSQEEDVTFEDDESVVKTKVLNRKKMIKVKGYNPADTEKLVSWSEEQMGKKFTNPIKQKKHVATMLSLEYAPFEIRDAWLALAEDPFWSEKGYDWAIVSGQISKAKKKKLPNQIY